MPTEFLPEKRKKQIEKTNKPKRAYAGCSDDWLNSALKDHQEKKDEAEKKVQRKLILQEQK